jgi:uncharacterized LabA/DUF88 family protein
MVQQTQAYPEYTAMPACRRAMVFIDGENLVFCYQSMLRNGRQHRDESDVTHIEDVLIWCSRFLPSVGLSEILRATYYTYAVGSNEKLDQIRDTIKGLQFSTHTNSRLPNTLTPQVFKKDKQSAKTKGVDIQMTVDILNHVHRDNVDIVMLYSGDGDYIPVIEEVLRCGKQCYISAFSDGLNPKLSQIADRFDCLDGRIFH